MGKYKSVKKAMHNNVLDRINMSLGASSSLDEKKAMREMKEELRKSGAGAAIANKNLTRIVGFLPCILCSTFCVGAVQRLWLSLCTAGKICPAV